jgi:hypothetical protein
MGNKLICKENIHLAQAAKMLRSGFKTLSEAQWSANIRGGLQTSLRLIPPAAGLRFPDRSDALPLNLIWGFETTSMKVDWARPAVL